MLLIVIFCMWEKDAKSGNNNTQGGKKWEQGEIQMIEGGKSGDNNAQGGKKWEKWEIKMLKVGKSGKCGCFSMVKAENNNAQGGKRREKLGKNWK